MMDLKNLVKKDQEAEILLKNPSFLLVWEELYKSCPWATIFQSKEFVLNWYQCFESYPKIIITDWDGQQMTGLLTLTKRKDILTGAGIDLAEYQTWISSSDTSDEFFRNALHAIKKDFPKNILYLKYFTASVPLNLFIKGGSFYSQTFLRPYLHPLMETNLEILETELKKKNKKEKINRLKRLGNLEFFEVKEIKRFCSLIDEMALQSDFRKGAFYNITFFHDEPERKTFLLKLFDLGLLHVSGLSVNDQLIASNAGIMGSDIVHLQGINSHSPFYSKYSPGILQFLMLGIELKKSGFKYFDLTPGGAEGYKRMLATKKSIAYEFWFTTKAKAAKKKWLEHVKNWLKPRLQGKSFWEVDLSNLNMAGLKLKLKFRFALKKILHSGKLEYCHFLESESIYFPFHEILGKYMSLESLSELYILRENHIPDLFLFDENSSLFPRMDIFSDCIVRMEYGQKMFTITKGEELIAICWFVPINAKATKTDTKESKRPPFMVTSYYKDMKAEELFQNIIKLQKDFLNKPIERLNIMVGKNQRALLEVLKK